MLAWDDWRNPLQLRRMVSVWRDCAVSFDDVVRDVVRVSARLPRVFNKAMPSDCNLLRDARSNLLVLRALANYASVDRSRVRCHLNMFRNPPPTLLCQVRLIA